MASRKSWNQIRERRLARPAAKAGYERARRAFELAEEIRNLREASGLSQAELARRIGSTQPAVARLEAGGVAPTIETLERVAAALGLRLAVSFSDGPHRPRKRSARAAVKSA